MRFHTLPIVLTVVLAAACTPAQSPADDEAAVAAAVKEFQTAMDTGDGPTVMRYLHDDALMMEGGTIEDRMQYEKDHLPADLEFAKGMTAKRMPVRQTVNGNVAWVRTSTEFSGTYEGKPLALRSLETMVLTRETVCWKIRARHWSGQRLPAN